jgi:hypothetical protein
VADTKPSEPNYAEFLGDVIHRYKRRLGRNAKGAIAARAGIAAGTMSRYLEGDLPRPDMVRTICDAICDLAEETDLDKRLELFETFRAIYLATLSRRM